MILNLVILICHWLLTFQMKIFFFLETFSTPLKKSTLYISFSMQKMSWVLLADFDLTLVAQIPCLKLICFWILCAPRKRHWYFSFCKAPYIYLVFSMCKVSWFLIVDFTLPLVTQTPPAKRLYSQSSRCSAKKAAILK